MIKSNWTSTEKKQLWIYALVAFGLPYLMGIPMGISQRAGNAVDAFPNAQMYYPAAAVMLALLLTAADKNALPRRFYGFFITLAAVMAGCAVTSAIWPGAGWAMGIQYVIMAGSLLGWVFLLTEKKTKRAAAGLCAVAKGKRLLAAGIITLFLALYLLKIFITVVASGQWAEVQPWFTSATPYIIFVSLLPSFFLSFSAFFGEEYGWRYFLQPLLQKRFGLRLGTVLLGVAWGLWHLPLNLFYYSPETSLQSIAAQIITCISLGVFFAFAYLKTGSIWVPVILHYLNNNMIPVITGSVDLSNQVYGWGDIGALLVLNSLFFLPFLASSVFKKKQPGQPSAKEM